MIHFNKGMIEVLRYYRFYNDEYWQKKRSLNKKKRGLHKKKYKSSQNVTLLTVGGGVAYIFTKVPDCSVRFFLNVKS